MTIGHISAIDILIQTIVLSHCEVCVVCSTENTT